VISTSIYLLNLITGNNCRENVFGENLNFFLFTHSITAESGGFFSLEIMQTNEYRRVLAYQYAESLIHAGYFEHGEKVKSCCQSFLALICEYCASLKMRAVVSHCHVRLCPFCEESRSLRNREICRELLDRVRVRPKMLTLTVRNRDEISADWISEIMKSFRRMRQRKRWKDLVRAGTVSLEITYSEQKGFHPHLHCSLDSDYFPQAEISEMWKSCTRSDGYVVDIREFKGVEELSKYVCKASDYAGEWKISAALFEAVKGKRLFGAFGAWYGLYQEIKKAIEADRKSKVCPDCSGPLTFFGSLDQNEVYLCKETGDFYVCEKKAREIRISHAQSLERWARAAGF